MSVQGRYSVGSRELVVHPSENRESYENEILQYVKVSAGAQGECKPAPADSGGSGGKVNGSEKSQQ